MSIAVKLGNLELRTPLIGASGLFGYGDGYRDLIGFDLFGAVVTKTITLKERQGNHGPRLVDVGFGLINSIGLENIGIDRFLDEVLPSLDLNTCLFVSIGGFGVDEYAEIAKRLDCVTGIDALEVNISCPNVSDGGIAFGSNARLTAEVISSVRENTKLPIIAKLPPLTVGIEVIVKAAQDAGAQALTLANTYPAMAIDIDSERPSLGAISGGLSGRAIKPLTLLLVWKAYTVAKIPIIASGGVEDSRDCIEYLLAGASACEIGSIMLRDLDAPLRIVHGIKNFIRTHGYRDIGELLGKAHRKEERSETKEI